MIFLSAFHHFEIAKSVFIYFHKNPIFFVIVLFFLEFLMFSIICVIIYALNENVYENNSFSLKLYIWKKYPYKNTFLSLLIRQKEKDS